jgi:hypothetical protein
LLIKSALVGDFVHILKLLFREKHAMCVTDLGQGFSGKFCEDGNKSSKSSRVYQRPTFLDYPKSSTVVLQLVIKYTGCGNVS